MCHFTVNGEVKNSKIQIGKYYELLRNLDGSIDSIYITDSNLAEIYKEFLEDKNVIVIPAGDKNKNLITMDSIYEKLILCK